MQWFYLVQGQRQGPVDDAALESLVRQGVVRDDTYVWRDGLAEWQTYGAVKPKPATTPAPVSPPQAVAPVAPAPEATPTPGPTSASGFGAPSPARPERPSDSPTASTFGATGAFGASPGGASHGAASGQARPYSPSPAAAPVQRQSPAAGAKSSGAFFFYPVLDALSDGSVIRKWVVIGLKIAAIVEILAGLLVAVTILTAAGRGSAAGLLGGIIAAVLILVTSLCVAQILWYRSGSVAALGQSRYNVIPIFSVLSRGFGEAAAAGLAGLGIASCLLLWLTPAGDIAPIGGIPFVSGLAYQGGGFIAGLVLLVYMVGSGFGALIVGYLWAECIMLLVDIEQNTRDKR